MRAVWVSGVLAAALFIGVFVYLLPLKPGVIALQFAWPRAFGCRWRRCSMPRRTLFTGG